MQSSRAYYLLLIIFAVSGFAGLIYESVWAQYLKLFLGHASYAQTMVLCIFMGGLASGAWITARYTHRIRHPLLVYAAVEAVLGVLGMMFHGVFTRAMDLHYQALLPLTTDPMASAAIKGLLALLLIGPQTVLLGATFPLMTVAVLRVFPESSGHKIAMLYFSNSAGAAAGVLVSVFILIPWSGLPGTMLGAGLLNALVALVVWLIVRGGGMQARHAGRAAAGAESPAGGMAVVRMPLPPWVLFATAAFTGTASFVYEVVWIRMLSLVLGASTHSFELMLSAFIAGLALGSLAVRRLIDRIAEPYRLLGYIQVVMGLFALGSLWAYGESFHWMAALMSGIGRSDQGYALFLLASHAICFAVMLPATFMAGMTLPLITRALLGDGYGERAVGAVYSANTLGSIAGVVLALHFAIPLTGLKAALITGAGLDIVVGIALLGLIAGRRGLLRPVAAAIVSVAGVSAAAWGVALDPHKLNSGVYRHQKAVKDANIEFLYTGDGKTASVSLHRYPSGLRVLTTNGKADAGLMPLQDRASKDEHTMILLGGLAMAFLPDSRGAANIGLGSGLTTQVLLRNPRLETMHSIEIEQKIIDADQLLRDRVEGIFSDPRSSIIVDDAKSFFAAHRARYDIIVAEPSNPWVSGVASLFTAEFYRRMLDHLNERGVFVQWLQLYEIDHESVASVMLALGQAFPNYTVYTANDADLLVVAWKDTAPREPDASVLTWPELRADWQRIGIEGMQDIEARRVGSKALLDPLFRSYPVPANSDYFPYLDDRAARARFLGFGASGFKALGVAGLPLTEMLEAREPPQRETRVAESVVTDRAAGIRNAMAAYRFLSDEKLPSGMVAATRVDLAALAAYCGGSRLFADQDALNALAGIAGAVTPFLTQEESRRALSIVLRDKCMERLGEKGRLLGGLIERIIERDGAGMRSLGERLLARLPEDGERNLSGFALEAAMLGAITERDPARAHALWQRYRKRVQTDDTFPIGYRLMLSTATARMEQR